MAEKIKVITGSVTQKEFEKYNICKFKAMFEGSEEHVTCQMFDQKATPTQNFDILKEHEGKELEIGKKEDKGTYGWQISLPAKGGGFGGGGGGRPKYSGKVFTTEEFLRKDHEVSSRFAEIVRQTATVDNSSTSQKLTADALAEAIRSRVSQYWILIGNNVIKD